MASSCSLDTPLTTANAKRCRRCWQVKAIAEFRRRYTGTEDRHTLCRDCFNADVAQRRAKKRNKELHRFNQQVNRQAQSIAAVIATTAEMIARFGGVDRFATAWKEVLDRASADGKPHLVVRGMLTVVNLINASTVLRESGPQPVEMDDDDLCRAMDKSVIRIVQQNPELAISAARRLGWTIMPNAEHAEECHQI